MRVWHFGQGPITPAKAAGTVNRLLQTGQAKVRVSGDMAFPRFGVFTKLLKSSQYSTIFNKIAGRDKGGSSNGRREQHDRFCHWYQTY